MIDKDGENLGESSLADALAKAAAAKLDLVEIQPNKNPPIAKIMDHGRHAFQQKKKRKDQSKRTKKQKLKEIKFRPSTDKGDYEVKLRNLRSFLSEGNKVKITVWFKGREMAYQDLGANLLEKIKADLEDVGKVEHFPKLEGRQLTMILAPKK